MAGIEEPAWDDVLKWDKVSACWQKGWRRRRGPRRSEGNLHDVKRGGQVERSQPCDKTLVPGCWEARGKRFRRSGETQRDDKLRGVPTIRRPLHFLLRTVSDNRVTGVTARLQSSTGSQGDSFNSCGCCLMPLRLQQGQGIISLHERSFVLDENQSCGAPI